MSTTTANYGLIKPALTDAADITAMNANWDKIDTELSKGSKVVNATSTDGVTYTATVVGVSALYNGLELTIIPNITSTAVAITLNLNGLGAVAVRLPLSTNTTATTVPDSQSFFVANKPVKLMYDGNYWKTVDKQKTSANDLYGITPVTKGGTGVDTVTEYSFLIGNGTDSMVEKTPDEVRDLIDAAQSEHTHPYLPLAGGTLTGELILTEGVHYGADDPPLAGTKGRIYFKKIT